MLECYFDLGEASRSARDRAACSAVMISNKATKQAFDCSWRLLLLKHELTEFNLKDWGRIAKSKGWDRVKKRAVIQDFIDALGRHDLICLMAVMEPDVWSGLEPRRKRLFGSIKTFSFMRSAGLVLDRVEAVNRPDRLSFVFARELVHLVDDVDLVKRFFEADSRAERRVGSIQYSDMGQCSHLQAAHLLACMGLKAMLERSVGKLNTPAWLKEVAGLSSPFDPGLCEYWDKSFADRHIASVEWSAAGTKSRSRRRQS